MSDNFLLLPFFDRNKTMGCLEVDVLIPFKCVHIKVHIKSWDVSRKQESKRERNRFQGQKTSSYSPFHEILSLCKCPSP
jgi:hypothetical protein